MSAVYNLRSHKLDNFIVTKFDDDFNIESYYEMTVSEGEVRCGCPAGVRLTCRHRQMFAELLTRLDTAWFLDFDTRQWVDPTGTASEASSAGQDDESLDGYCGASPDAARKIMESRLDPRGSLGSSPSSQPHSTTVSAADFESADEGSNPSVAAKPADTHPFRRRM